MCFMQKSDTQMSNNIRSESDTCEELEPSTPKLFRSEKDYKNYEQVFPSARVIGRKKILQAIQSERNCALAMLNTEESDNMIVHHDTGE